jgi:acetyl esterase/lipase
MLKTALVRLPRAVPMDAMRITSPEGPQPYKLKLPSRHAGKSIPLFVFIPPTKFPSLESGSTVPEPSEFPVVMDYHGGGFYLGSCLEQAPFCAKLCRELQCIVISVDYRMAPLDKFPAAIEDCEDVVQALLNSTWQTGYEALRKGISDFLRSTWFAELEAAATKEDRKAGKVPTPPAVDVKLDLTRLGFSGASSGGNLALNMVSDYIAC